jgi:hypothetical protein
MFASSTPVDLILFGKRRYAQLRGAEPQPGAVAAETNAAVMSARLQFFDWRVIMLLMGVLITFTWAAAWAWLALRIVLAVI